MDRQPAKRSGLFLIELILAILFFSVAAAICLLLFTKAHTLETDSRNLSQAVNACSSVAEIVRSQDDPLTCLQKIYPDGSADMDDHSFCIYLSETWTLCGSEEASFVLELELSLEDTMLSGEIMVIDKNEPDKMIYALPVRKYFTSEVIS